MSERESKSAKRKRSQLERAHLDGAARLLRDAREGVNQYAATSTDQDGRSLLAISVGSHIAALHRLQTQLLTPVEPEESHAE